MGDIYNTGNLEQNLGMLSEKKVDLDNLKHQVEKRSKRYREGEDSLLHNIEDKQLKIEELQSKFNEINIHRFRLNKVNARYELNKNVIENLKAVNNLIDAGNDCPELIRAFLSEVEIGQPRSFSRAEIMLATSNLSESNIIRSDSFGKVYKGKFRNGKQLSVKMLVNDDVSPEDVFMSEVTTLSNASHRHLSKLYGYCFEKGVIALVYEYLENGSSFAELLFKRPHSEEEWDKCYDIAIKIAKAISYLHDGCDDPIIHRDLKVSNVLLDKNNSPKIADFGVAKLIKDGRSHVTLTKNRGTPGYAAPEMWIPSSPITCKCDVYSFGIMLFEILAREVLVQKKGQIWFPQRVWNKYESDQLDDIIEDGFISEKNKTKARTLAMVALQCIQAVPKERPSMSTVVKILELEIPVKNPITCPFPKRFISSNQSSSG